tara:strand:+ start:92 stop:397 length:306 start_codon:yes stop_codon:yes gene_type:complete
VGLRSLYKCAALKDLLNFLTGYRRQGSLVMAEPGMVEAPIAVPAVKVEKVVDTTGAGDSFNGGYLSARIKGESILEAARKGRRFAAQVIQYRGAVVPIDLS